MVAMTPLYAALLTLLFVVLSARIILHRRGRRISLGDGGDPAFQRRIRAQGNLAEYAPLGLLLLLLLELGGAAPWALHGLGLMLLAGRLAHAAAFSGGGSFLLRTGGTALTLAILILSALTLLVRGF